MTTLGDLRSYVDPHQLHQAIELAATLKAEQPTGWRPYRYEAVTGGLLITGCMTRPKQRGPNKGQPHFLTQEAACKVVVTKEDIDQALTYLQEERGL